MKNLLLLTTMISGCSMWKQRVDPRTIHDINPEFVEYVILFENEYGSSIGDVSIGFNEQSENVIGVCKKMDDIYRQIEIDREYWETASKEAKMGLIFHELGHCVLDREHDSEYFKYNGLHMRGEVPASLMFPYNFYSSHYNELEDYYKYELFHPHTENQLRKNHSEDSIDLSNPNYIKYTEIVEYK